MRETYGTCDGCGQSAPLLACLMDDDALWPLCDACMVAGLMTGAVQAPIAVAHSGANALVGMLRAVSGPFAPFAA